ncbi:malto-oligosyltrehalose trehalohydrolase [Motilibacter sp. E257]|uniref:Malto-oligosyltrehalose trehalohydrolase n=1 Tax=Motilibacter deserti TaxID=2714956 RepID=A0ABX0GSR6_9ACTN|nr:malto-oligosyltrehalose trehalohydrolase [Motilibacter deserti]NHC13917.1 malto-oligosyltrehalose trehalohydrolase [Motilibacter deserti]
MSGLPRLSNLVEWPGPPRGRECAVTTFRVWAPKANDVELDLSGQRSPMTSGEGGWWTLEVPDAGHGTDYGYVVDGEGPTPDPRSLWQPEGVHGPSRVYEHDRFGWTDTGWTGRQLAGSVVYELHVGTFTAEGTFDAAIGRLDELAELGIDLVEVMPIASFPGRHGWGYDGVHLYAAHEPYGGPDGFKRFVDAAHARGLGVVLDVVYNHLGPSGNYLSRFGPYFTGRHSTPWGDAVNLDDEGSDEVRRFLIDNATTWLRDFHVDGLRLDAVHALVDERATHVLAELADEVDRLSTALRRPLSLIAESDRNDASFVTAREANGYGLTAQWDDDVHHALHGLLTGESQGYYADFAEDPTEALAATFTGAFFHAGTWSSFRGRTHGAPVDPRIPAYRFVAYTQTHDQVGNRATGDRLAATLTDGRLKIAAALVLTGPFTPMLFMGEEYAAATPWQYFTDHQEPELAEAVRQGRRREFASHGWAEEDVPDPQDAATRDRSVLDWDERQRDERGLLAWYSALIALRRSRPELTDPRLDEVAVELDDEGGLLVVHRGPIRVVVNLAEEAASVVLSEDQQVQVLLESGGVSYDGEVLEVPADSVAVVELA